MPHTGGMTTTNTTTNTWHDSPRGGTYCRTSGGYLARPFDRVGMSTVRPFATMADALAYADTPSR